MPPESTPETQAAESVRIDPSKPCSLYDKFSPAWELQHDFAEMHQHTLESGKYLDRFGVGSQTVEAQKGELRPGPVQGVHRGPGV